MILKEFISLYNKKDIISKDIGIEFATTITS
jgi:hypothetical protein